MKMTTYRLTFDIDTMSYVGAAYATARAEERMNLDVDAGIIEHGANGLEWTVDVPAVDLADHRSDERGGHRIARDARRSVPPRQ